jgi:murein DD-endopeptidase MepM/ murein hydrolase activator NlpD
LMVTIQHDGGVVSRYAHLRRIKVKPNQRVGVQTPLGLLGSTGMSTGKHLHLEIFISGKPVNPDRVLRMAQHVQQVKTDQR